MSNHMKVAITGAAGQIGYALLFRIASGEMFGCQTTIDLQLLELPQALPALRGVQMELEDGAFPLLRNIVCTDDVNVAMDGINWALLVGAVPRKPGMQRRDLLEINAPIFKTQGQAINHLAADDIQILVVGNPCNTNGMITMNATPDIPRDRFYAMTMLDELRARFQLAKKASVLVEQIQNMIIWGNHSATQFPDFYHAKVDDKNATEIVDLNWLQQDFIRIIQARGAEVLKTRGTSSAASAANAVVRTVQSIMVSCPGAHYSLAKCSQGEYGIDENLIFSFPCQTIDGRVEVVEGIEHHGFAKDRLLATLNELRDEKNAINVM